MPAATLDQRILWPGYAPPNWWVGFPNSAWNNFADYAQCGLDRTGSIAIMNPASGPGTGTNSDWSAVTNHARNNGHKVVGYVDTNYTTRNIMDVINDINKYYTWYGMDGIFFDRMSNNVTDRSYYDSLYAIVKSKSEKAIVVGNPGATAPTDWQLKPRCVDILVNFEDTAANYLAWSPPSWISGYIPANFSHLVHACASTNLVAVIAKSRATRAGYRYITDDTLPNPWDTLAHWPIQATP